MKFDYVVIGAGIANPSLYVSNPVETMLSNINGVSNILKNINKDKIKKIIYISSSEVYGIKNSEAAFKEEDFGKLDLLSVRSSYAVSKISSEYICKSYFSEYGIPLCIVRPGHIFGPSASPKDERISSKFCFEAAKGNDLVVNGDGMQKRSYCYSLDCALAILVVLLNGRSGEPYNIGHTEQTTIKQLVSYISSYCGVKLSILNQNKTIVSNPMLNSCLNITKLKEIGYQPIFSCKEAVEHTIQTIKEIYKL